MPTGNAVTVAVHGLKELEQKLAQLPEAIAYKALSGALMSAGNEIAKEAKRLAPKGSVEHYIGSKAKAKGKKAEPGNLRDNIRRTKVKESKHSAEVRIGWNGHAFYGQFIEFGTAKMPARPFLRPAFDAKKEKALEVFKKRLAVLIKRQAEKLAKEGNHARR